MAKQRILRYPDPALRGVSEDVTAFDESLLSLVTDLTDTMRAADGLGIAAPQIGVRKRVVVLEASVSDVLVFVNPKVKALERAVIVEEGCLSFPAIFTRLSRPVSVEVEAFDETGRLFTMKLDGPRARALQHECDHLDGVLFIDYLSSSERRLLLRGYR